MGPSSIMLLLLLFLHGGEAYIGILTHHQTTIPTPTTNKPTTEASNSTIDPLSLFYLYYGLGAPLLFNEVDPFHENTFWNQIKGNKTQIVINKIKNSSAIMPEPKDKSRYLKVVAISDTHNQLAGVTIPDGDVFIHAGDITNYGERERLIEFNDHMGRLPHPHKLVIAGNHELGFDKDEKIANRSPREQKLGTNEGWKLLTNVTYILDEAITIDGESNHP